MIKNHFLVLGRSDVELHDAPPYAPFTFIPHRNSSRMMKSYYKLSIELPAIV